MSHHNRSEGGEGVRDESSPQVVDQGLIVVLAMASLIVWQLQVVVTGDGWMAQWLFPDSDPYLYFNRVQLLEAGQAWFDKVDPRVNAPHGHEQHWTRPMDLMFWGGAKVLGSAMAFKDGLALWGAVWATLLHFALFGGLYWAAKPLGRNEGIVAATIGVVQLPVLTLFEFGQANHNPLLLVLLVAVLGCVIRRALGNTSRRWAIWAGGIAGIALWFNLSALLWVLIAYVVIGVLWLFGHRGWERFGLLFSGAALVSLTMGGVIEWGPAFWRVSHTDTIGFPLWLSVVWATLFWLALVGASWGLNRHRVGQWSQTLGRAVAALVALLMVGVGIWATIPEILAGPYANATDLYMEARLPYLGVHAPFLSTISTLSEGLNKGFSTFGMPLVALAVAVRQWLRHRGEEREAVWSALALVIGLLLVCTLRQLRWAAYLNAVSGISFSLVFIGGLQALYRRNLGVFMVAFRPLAMCILVFWPVLIGVMAGALIGLVEEDRSAVDLDPEIRAVSPEAALSPESERCDLRPLAQWVDDHLEGPDVIAMIYAQRGAEWIFRTGLKVTAVGNHRPQQGFELKQRVFGQRDMQAAVGALRRAQIELVVVCPSHPRWYWLGTADHPTFYQALVRERPPPGMQRLVGGEKVGRWVLYAVAAEPALSQ